MNFRASKKQIKWWIYTQMKEGKFEIFEKDKIYFSLKCKIQKVLLFPFTHNHFRVLSMIISEWYFVCEINWRNLLNP